MSKSLKSTNPSKSSSKSSTNSSNSSKSSKSSTNSSTNSSKSSSKKSNVLAEIKDKKVSKKIYRVEKYDLGDGAKVTYIPNYVNNPDNLFDELLENISWTHFKYEVYDKEVTSPRLMNIIHYDKTNDKINDVSNLTELAKIKRRVEKLTDVKFNYAVLNYYRDGNDYVGYHPDREVKDGQIVVSVSVGDTRRFALKHKYREGVRHVFNLNNGDVLILNDAAIKTAYKHSVPKMAKAGPRINVTFRQ